ncbi:MAG: DUF3096 domain-containing protein [Steroidobacterales bacterium]
MRSVDVRLGGSALVRLNYIVTIYLMVIGLVGLFGTGGLHA